MSKVASIKKVTQKFSSALLCISMFGNFCFGVFGQNSEPATNRTRVTLTRAANELQAFSRVLPFASVVAHYAAAVVRQPRTASRHLRCRPPGL